MSAKRIAVLKKQIKAANLDGYIVNHLDHVRYLSGFTGSAGMLVLHGGATEFLTDFRYVDQAAKEVKGARVTITQGDPIATLAGFKKLDNRNLRLGFNPEFMNVKKLEMIKRALPNALLIPSGELFDELGWVKDAAEISSIKKAVKISDLAFDRILNLIAPGIRESELAAELEYQMMMMGSEKPAFESIIASGYRSAMPHGVASSKVVKKGEFLTFDFGATVDGYVSDITRTVVVGKATSRQKKIYNLVLKAQMAGIRKVKSGVLASKVDAACRDIITKAGYGKNFGHGTGHGIGYFVHVGPRVSGKSTDKLKPNNVITIEPGIYISGWGGVRIEDDVQVTRSGCKVLNTATKKLLEL